MPPKIDRAALLFSLNSFAAAMLALFIAFSLGLPRPYWAMSTAYIVSQPLSGAVRSKAVYRLMGTLLGAAAAVFLVPTLVNAPILLSLALSLWVGGCLAVSLLDRTPRSYLMMLAGYTAAIIGFPSVAQPGAIFDTAVLRVVEIGLGILCATLVHSLIFPRPVGDIISARARAWLGDADRWALDLLSGRGGGEADRRHLAAAASEIHLLATHLPFDTSRLRETTDLVRTLHDRMLLLIPILSGISDRLSALAEAGEGSPVEGGLVEPPLRDAISELAAWISGGCDAAEAPGLDARLVDATPPGGAWRDLLSVSLVTRLRDLVLQLSEAHALAAALAAPDAPLPAGLAPAVSAAATRRLHRDPGLALLSGFAAAVAIMLTCAIWIGAGWGDGAAAAVMAAVFCCFFASLDDPAPAIARFGLGSLVSLPICALYLFAVLPALGNSFVLLVAALAPTLVTLALFVPDPRTSGLAMAVIMGFCNGLALTETFSADAAGFLNANLAQFVGMFTAIFVTRAMRSMSAETSARRLLRSTWRALAALARGAVAPQPAEFAGRLVDRLGLLTPKLAEADPTGQALGADVLRDLRVGMNVVALQASRAELEGAPRQAFDELLVTLGDHFDARVRGRETEPGPDLLARLDRALATVVRSDPDAARRQTPGLVGLRRNLFPQAAAFRGAPEEAAA